MTETIPADPEQVAVDLDWPIENWAHQCHGVSIAIVKHYGVGRVARGACTGVRSQHSWIVLGDDCYAEDAEILDPTLWSYDETVTDKLSVWSARDGRHTPHGHGTHIMQWGVPPCGDGEAIELTPRTPLSPMAKLFLGLVADANGRTGIDREGWMNLSSNVPVIGWPAGEIYAAMDDTAETCFMIPVDRLGMLTDRNPGGLYLPGDEVDRDFGVAS